MNEDTLWKHLIGFVFGAIVGAAVTGCAPAPDIFELRIDPTAHPDQALAAAADWEQRTDVRFLPVILTSEGCVSQNCIFLSEISRVDFPQGLFGSGSCSTVHGDGCTVRDPTTWISHVYIATEDNDYNRVWGLRHELGHALGLPHLGTSTLMHATMEGGSREITDGDVWEYGKVRSR